MARSKKSCLTTCSISLLLFSLIGLLLLAGAVLILPGQAAQKLGPPSPQLSYEQVIRLSAQLLWRSKQLDTPADPRGAPRSFQVSLGEPVSSIAARLQAEGLIDDASAFRAYLVYSGLDKTLQAGDYTLSPAMSPIEIGQGLQDPTPTEATLTILAGWRLEEIAAALPTSGLQITPEQFLDISQSQPEGYAFLEHLPHKAGLEGFFFPGAYTLPRDLPATELVTALLDSFDAQLSSELQRGFERQGLDIYEAVTLASILQREAVSKDEMPLIASVFYNRLAIGMRLEADSTTQYALGYNPVQKTWWTNPLASQDLKVDSPYNTYLYPGLPFGPIANPGLSALRAVAFPAQTPYYYFRATCDGSGKHTFAETFEEHVQNECP